MNTTTLKRWGCLTLAACTLMTACQKPLAPVSAVKASKNCFISCERERTRCNTLCTAANEQCTSNTKYMQQRHQKSSTETIQVMINLSPCETNCGCIPSRMVCFKLCDGKTESA